MTNEYLPPRISSELGRAAPEAALDRNYFALGSTTPILSEIDGIPVSKLIEQFGSPLFVFSERTLREKARCLREAFKSRYENVSFAWSYKTNYLNAICQTFHQEGWIAEVVSDFEYQKARKLGVFGQDIVFNGPYKPTKALELAIKEGALIQIDNWDELGTIELLTKDRQEPLDVGIRIWLDAGIQTVWSKFGFALNNGEAARAAERILNNPKLNLHTLHSHIGTYILSPNAYRVTAEKLLALREQIYVEHNHTVDCINLGGGFPSQSLLHGMLGPVEHIVPPIEAYADVIADVFNQLPENKKPKLRFESGRYLVDEAGYLLTTVVAIKGSNRHPASTELDLAVNDHKEYINTGEHSDMYSYVIDGGVNILYTATWYQMNVFPSRAIDSPALPSRLYGPLCMAIDVVRYNINLPPLKLNDILTIHPVGAYNMPQSMQFITYRPAVVLISENGVTEIIRKREVLEDIDGPEQIPEHLSAK